MGKSATKVENQKNLLCNAQMSTEAAVLTFVSCSTDPKTVLKCYMKNSDRNSPRSHKHLFQSFSQSPFCADTWVTHNWVRLNVYHCYKQQQGSDTSGLLLLLVFPCSLQQEVNFYHRHKQGFSLATPLGL